MTIGSVEQRAGRANLNAIATLRTVEPAEIGPDNSVGAPTSGLDRILAHPFVTNSSATFAQNATLRIIRNDGR